MKHFVSNYKQVVSLLQVGAGTRKQFIRCTQSDYAEAPLPNQILRPAIEVCRKVGPRSELSLSVCIEPLNLANV